MKINGLDLFSGIGGVALALAPWVETKAYCEIDPYCQKLLTQHMQNSNLDIGPIYPDVTQLRGEDLGGTIDIISGGFPCQDISVAGLGRGLEGERSGLFFEIARLAGELSPSFIFLENVPAITTRGGTTVIAELTKIGYECRWTTLSAKAVGANHKRERWWLLAKRNDSNTRCEREGAHQSIRPKSEKSGVQNVTKFCETLPASTHVVDTDSEKCARLSCGAQAKESITGSASPLMGDSYHHGQPSPEVGTCAFERGDFDQTRAKQAQQFEGSGEQHATLANACCAGRKELDATTEPDRQGYCTWCLDPIWSSDWWAVEPDVGRVAHGIPARVDRIKALGNSVVPLQARTAFDYLLNGRLPNERFY